MLQDILGMFKRKIFRTPTDEDVFIVGKLRQSRNKFDDPKIDQTLVKLKDLKTAIGGVSATNTGTGEEVLKTPVVGSNLKFRTLRAGSNITLTQNADDIQIDAAGGGGIVGIADTSGTYTYYNKLNDAIAAATPEVP